jgi:hypothetical protein
MATAWQEQDTSKEPARYPEAHYNGIYHGGLEVAPNLPPPVKPDANYPQHWPAQERTILGLRRPTFFLSLALAFVIIAAAIGGGVGGSMAVENAKK